MLPLRILPEPIYGRIINPFTGALFKIVVALQQDIDKTAQYHKEEITDPTGNACYYGNRWAKLITCGCVQFIVYIDRPRISQPYWNYHFFGTTCTNNKAMSVHGSEPINRDR